jgi:hypothetical protein
VSMNFALLLAMGLTLPSALLAVLKQVLRILGV